MKVLEFQGEYRFLSNFWPAAVVLDSFLYPSVEHAYQAAKTLNPEIRSKIRELPKPGDAKRFAKMLQLRPDWKQVKLSVMEDLVRQKFFMNQFCREKLLETGEAELIEGNTWNDTFWGVCRGKGENHLGKILMKVRAELQGA